MNTKDGERPGMPGEKCRDMNMTTDIRSLLQEIGTAYEELVQENVSLKEKILHLKTELKTAQNDRDQVTQTLQSTQMKLDQFHPEMQTLRDQLEQTEVETNKLSIEVSQKNGEIQQLEDRIRDITQPRSSPVD